MRKKRRPDPAAPGTAGDDESTVAERISDPNERHARSDADQIASGADRGHAEADQTSSDLDQLSAGRDQALSDLDQRASDRDQAAADRELRRHGGDPSWIEGYAASKAERQAGTLERQRATLARLQSAEERARQAGERDEEALRRDITARARDEAAAKRDVQMAERERRLTDGGPAALEATLEYAVELRRQAARDRARAAEDRACAAQDRTRGAEEREQVIEELRRSHRDELTGAFRRAFGEELIRGEIQRARRGDGKLVLAFVDIDSLREINNRRGHLAGDAVLQEVVSAIQRRIRSYEPVVRFGGDEFMCAISNIDRPAAARRFGEIAATVEAGTFSVGFAELRPDDTLESLIARADADLIASRD